MHIEDIMKMKYKMERFPLGRIVKEKEKQLDLNILKLLKNVVFIWNEVKHELDNESLTFEIKQKYVVKVSKTKFNYFEVI